MTKYGRRGAVLAILLAIALCLPVLMMSTGAVTTSAERAASYPAVTLTYGGKNLSVSARRIDGHLFVPLGSFSNLFTDATYRYSSSTGYATLTAPGLTLTAGNGGSFLTANDRCLYGVRTNRLMDGVMWVPLNPLAKALGLTVSYRSGAASAGISGYYRALTPAASFYRSDEVYWLSRIISAESRGEPLTGQIAVGNVVLNRVRSSGFPNTIWGVIFEKNQFSPVLNGTIYQSPAWISVCAAKMCLEGYSVSNDVLFFCNVAHSTSHWIADNRTFAFSIGAHSFYL